MARLTGSTVVRTDSFDLVSLKAGDVLPEWAEGLVGEHLLSRDGEGRDAPTDGDTDDTAGVPDGSWTMAQLREYAKAHAIDLAGASTKADLLAAVEG